MAAAMMVNECLCFASHWIARVTKSVLTENLASFYHDEELLNAKQDLCKIAAACAEPIDGWTKYVNSKHAPINRKGEGLLKRSADADDIVSMLMLLDVSHIECPTFVAAKLDRLPPNVCMTTSTPSVHAEVAALTTTLNNVMDRLVEVQQAFSFSSTGKATGQPTSVSSSQPVTAAAVVPVKPAEQVMPVPATVSWAGMAANMATTGLATTIPTVSAPNVLRGSKKLTTNSAGLKTVPRQAVCFIGRLDIETEEKQLCEYMQSFGVMKASCRKLAAKDGRTFATAAFRVACSPEYCDKLFDMSNWPEGTELREWVFQKKNG